LGKASGGLCAIDFDRDKDLSTLLAVNPKLESSLRSKAPQFEWRATGNLSTIAGRHEKGMDYHLLCETPPARLAFEEIVWPEGWDLPWLNDVDAELRQLYGEPFYTNDKGAYWAGLHARENVVFYEPDEKRFTPTTKVTGMRSSRRT
jgi:hypothetical protein